jgi:Na+-transporting methylmalonyl-CoA/oxaloacetate decarboxylase gamma subunit
MAMEATPGGGQPHGIPSGQRHSRMAHCLFVLGTSALLAVLAVLAVLVAACGALTTTPAARTTPTANSSATATAAAQATQAAAPVLLDLNVSVRGTAAQHDVQVSMQVTVHNRNPFPIGIAGECSNPPIRITISNTASGFFYQSIEAPVCPNASASDLRPAVPAGGAHIWTYTYGYAGETDLVAGTYKVTADIHHWHAGTIEQQFTPNPPPWGTATATTAVSVP